MGLTHIFLDPDGFVDLPAGTGTGTGLLTGTGTGGSAGRLVSGEATKGTMEDPVTSMGAGGGIVVGFSEGANGGLGVPSLVAMGLVGTAAEGGGMLVFGSMTLCGSLGSCVMGTPWPAVVVCVADSRATNPACLNDNLGCHTLVYCTLLKDNLQRISNNFLGGHFRGATGCNVLLVCVNVFHLCDMGLGYIGWCFYGVLGCWCLNTSSHCLGSCACSQVKSIVADCISLCMWLVMLLINKMKHTISELCVGINCLMHCSPSVYCSSV